MSERSMSYHCTAGSSDKVYFLSLVAEGDLFVVRTAYGPRGGTMTHGQKTPAPVSLEQAVKVFEKEHKARLGKDYRLIGGDAPVSVGESTKADSGFRPQLLNPITDAEAEALILDPNWMCQIKFDGERRTIDATSGLVEGINRKGQIVALPIEVATLISELPQGQGKTRIDGEIMGTTFAAFDLLIHNGRDLTALPAEARYELLMALLGEEPSPIVKARAAMTTDDKRRMIEQARQDNEEGVCFKRKSAPYVANRPASLGDALKLKFYETAAVRVASLSAGKRSVQMEALDANGAWVCVGSVTVPPNWRTLPEVGEIIDVRYLYRASENGALFQPTLIRLRHDLDDSHCDCAQFKVKGVSQHAA